MRGSLRSLLLAALLLAGGTAAARAQAPADTAAVLLDAARRLQREGRADAAVDLLNYLRRHYAGTTAARSADSLLGSLPQAVAATGAGRTGFVTFNTLYGGFLGLAIPAAFNQDDATAAGIGLLIGAPAGFFASRAFARKHFHSAGQAGAASFVTVWGTWLGLGVQQALDIGDRETCNEFDCYSDQSDTAPWVAMSLGGLAGIGAGWALASTKEIRPGTSTLVAHSAFWGTWFGVSLGRVADLHGNGLFTSALLVGNAALLAAIPAAGSWRPSSSRVRLITAAGLAGGLAGLGIDLIVQPDDERIGFGIAAAGSAAGLLVGALATRKQRDLDSPEAGAGGANALARWQDGLHLGFPLPEPVTFRIEGRNGKPQSVRAVRFRLFDARF
jgi:hypothetical protein